MMQKRAGVWQKDLNAMVGSWITKDLTAIVHFDVEGFMQQMRASPSV